MEWQNLAFQATVDGDPIASGVVETSPVPASVRSLKHDTRSMNTSSPEAEEARSKRNNEDPGRSTDARPRSPMVGTRMSDQSNSRHPEEDQEASTNTDLDRTRGAGQEGQEDVENPNEQPSTPSINNSAISDCSSRPKEEGARVDIHPTDQIDGGVQETAVAGNQETMPTDEVGSEVEARLNPDQPPSDGELMHCHEGGDSPARELAVIPEVQISSTDEVKIEDICVEDTKFNTPEEIDRLRRKIWRRRHLLIGKGVALPPAARGAVCDIDVGGAKPIAQRVRTPSSDPSSGPDYRDRRQSVSNELWRICPCQARWGGYSAIVWKLPDWSVVTARSGYAEGLTVNAAKYYGLLLGINLLENVDRGRLVICGDSNLVVRQVRGEIDCKTPKLTLLQRKVLDQLRSRPDRELLHVKRAWNGSAGSLASAALQRQGGIVVENEADSLDLVTLNPLDEMLVVRPEERVAHIAPVVTRSARPRSNPTVLSEAMVRELRIDRITRAQDEEVDLRHEEVYLEERDRLDPRSSQTIW
ncbi:unnamed protein product [Phytophthora fragariaefolia]|uniref:Unnamed protein product n=1 Tax=Phytophthora fragariaefolia TaxID=1490495 RepID=A0A9W7D5I0_9STRA|nr:unnamed protein product [Phytophthora fragariaefolia]